MKLPLVHSWFRNRPSKGPFTRKQKGRPSKWPKGVPSLERVMTEETEEGEGTSTRQFRYQEAVKCRSLIVNERDDLHGPFDEINLSSERDSGSDSFPFDEPGKGPSTSLTVEKVATSCDPSTQVSPYFVGKLPVDVHKCKSETCHVCPSQCSGVHHPIRFIKAKQPSSDLSSLAIPNDSDNFDDLDVNIIQCMPKKWWKKPYDENLKLEERISSRLDIRQDLTKKDP